MIQLEDRRRVLLAHFEHPKGLTDYELADLVGLQQNSAGKRRGELRDRGLIRETNLRRLSPTGSYVVVWQITDKGRVEAEQMTILWG